MTKHDKQKSDVLRTVRAAFGLACFRFLALVALVAFAVLFARVCLESRAQLYVFRVSVFDVVLALI